MSDGRDDPEVFWIEPRIRAILPLDGFHLSRSLARTLRRESFEVTCNSAFSAVMEACAAPRATEDGGSWISHRIQASYERLHELGWAHSIECWKHGEDGERALVGGLYGVGFDKVFCGESMFSCASDSSKVALAWLVAALRYARVELLDCQFQTSHLESLGAIEIEQAEYLTLLRQAQRPYSAVDAALSLPEAFAALGEAAGVGVGEGRDARAGLVDEVSGKADSSPGKFIAQFLTQTS